MLVVKAVHSFIAEHGDELEFQAGEHIEIIEKDDAFGDGWWRVGLSLDTLLMDRVGTPKAKRGYSLRRTSLKIHRARKALQSRTRHPPPRWFQWELKNSLTTTKYQQTPAMRLPRHPQQSITLHLRGRYPPTISLPLDQSPRAEVHPKPFLRQPQRR
jgi:hypothetical protein